MHRKLKVILSALCVLMAAAFSGTAVISTAAATNLPNSFLIGDQDGVHVGADGNYYIDARKLKPGDVITKTLTIQNLSQDDRTAEAKVPYTLTMRSEPLTTTGPVDLLDAVHLELKLDGRTIYSGRCRGDGAGSNGTGVNMIQNALDLGTYNVGDRHTLRITLTVDSDMELSEEISKADFRWVFYAWRDTKADAPKTGIFEYGAWALAAGMGLLCLFLFLNKKKQQKGQAAAYQ